MGVGSGRYGLLGILIDPVSTLMHSGAFLQSLLGKVRLTGAPSLGKYRRRPVSYSCCTEESGLFVSLCNLWGVFGTGLHHDAAQKSRPMGDLSL